MTWVWSLGHTWWKKKSDSHKCPLTSICTVACSWEHTHTQTNSYLRMFVCVWYMRSCNLGNSMCVWGQLCGVGSLFSPLCGHWGLGSGQPGWAISLTFQLALSSRLGIFEVHRPVNLRKSGLHYLVETAAPKVSPAKLVFSFLWNDIFKVYK